MSIAVKRGYKIIVLCRTVHCALVERIVREQLDAARLAIDEVAREADDHHHLALVAARVYCSTAAERTTLIGLVTRLGLEPAVRSVRWENVSEKEPG